jgi:hypothetical protein
MHRPPVQVPQPTGDARARRRRISRRDRLGLLATLALALALALGAAPAAGAAQAAPPGPGPCPAPLPVAQVARDMTGYGLTVSAGTQPERFTVKVLGVLADGVAPDVDMIVVETDSPALDKAHGIWAGMSGSPVFTDDGRWIGAVAYGLAVGPSKIGGLAAAEDMAKVLDEGARADAQVRSTVQLPRELQAQVAASPDATASQAAAGLARLPVPLGVSGLGARRLGQVSDRLTGGDASLAPYPAAAAANGVGADPAEIVPGGNFAASISTGDVTAGGVGTTTVVCDGAALAFGHPFQNVGPASFGAHTADAITIQDDPTLVPFKLANIGGMVGTVDQDRRSAIRAALGKGPAGIPVTSTATDRASGRSREGTTNANDTRYLHQIATLHLLSSLDGVLDRIGSGRSEVRWTATGTTANGKAWTLTRDNRFAYEKDLANPFDDDIALVSIDELFRQLDQLRRTRLEQVRFTGVKIQAAVDSEWRGYRLGKVEAKVGSRWVVADRQHPITGRAGATTDVRVHLLPDRGQGGELLVPLAIRVPSGSAGQEGTLEIGGGQGYQGPVGTSGEPGSFDQLLRSLKDAPHNDEVLAALVLTSEDEAAPAAATARGRTPQVVTGQATIPFRIR